MRRRDPGGEAVKVRSLPRAGWVGAGVVLAAIVILILSSDHVLESGQLAAVLILDHNTAANQTFPYPFTIQNLMSVLFGAGIADAAYRWRHARREERSLSLGLLPTDSRTVLVDTDLPAIQNAAVSSMSAGPSFLSRLVEQCVLHFQANKAPDQTHSVLTSMTELEMHRMELRYGFLRYLAWLLPTLGFIGTVVGISLALAAIGQPGGAEGSSALSGIVTARLGIAFYSTIVALCQSAVLVLLMQAAQQREESALNASAEHCLRNLINRLYVPKSG